MRSPLRVWVEHFRHKFAPFYCLMRNNFQCLLSIKRKSLWYNCNSFSRPKNRFRAYNSVAVLGGWKFFCGLGFPPKTMLEISTGGSGRSILGSWLAALVQLISLPAVSVAYVSKFSVGQDAHRTRISVECSRTAVDGDISNRRRRSGGRKAILELSEPIARRLFDDAALMAPVVRPMSATLISLCLCVCVFRPADSCASWSAPGKLVSEDEAVVTIGVGSGSESRPVSESE